MDPARARLRGLWLVRALMAFARGVRRTGAGAGPAASRLRRAGNVSLSRVPRAARLSRIEAVRSARFALPRAGLRWRDYSLPRQLALVTVVVGVLAVLLNVALVGPFFESYFADQQGASIARQAAGLGRCCAGPGGPLLARPYWELVNGMEANLGGAPGRVAIVVTPGGHVRYASPMPAALYRALLARLLADTGQPPSDPRATPGWDRMDDQLIAEARLPSNASTTLFGIGVARKTAVALLLAEPASIARARRAEVGLVVALAGVVAMTLAMLAIVFAARRVMLPVRALAGAARGIAGGDYGTEVALAGSAELRELSLALSATMDEAQRQRRVEHDLLVDISHEISTPLKTIRGYTDALVGGVIRDEVTRVAMLHSIGDETTRLRRFSADLLDLALLETGKVTPQRELVAVADLLARLRERVGPAAARDGVKLTAQAVPALPAPRTDPLLLEQALVNLVENALHHTLAGGSISVRAYKAGAEVCLSVADTGSGLSAEELARVWRRFYGADAEGERREGEASIGLGLAIARSAIVLLGGHIAAQSTPGHGATFTVRLPLGGE